jgi:uroporphyrinogen decarboxylase
MTSKQRLLTALENRGPDRQPGTSHHVMPYFTGRYMNGMSSDEFFDYFGLMRKPLKPPLLTIYGDL